MAANKYTLTDLTAEDLRAVLEYNPATGIFVWRWREDVRPSNNSRWAGKAAGCHQNVRSKRFPGKETFYVTIRLRRRLYMAHRLAWLYMKGEWPPEGMEIDHRDGDGLNNIWENLRVGTHGQNMTNKAPRSSTGFKGVSRLPNGIYMAVIGFRSSRFHLGRFQTPEAAHAAYAAAARKLYGEFARTE